MAYIFDPLEEEKNQQNVQNNESVQNPAGAGIQTPGSPSATKGPSSSGSFTDIRKYLQANQPSIEQTGQKIENTLGSDISKAQASTQEAYNKATSGLTGGVTTEQKKALESGPLSEFTKNPENTKAVKDALSRNYQAPVVSDIYSESGNLTDKAVKQAGLVETPGGQRELLRNVYQKPERATAGMLGLDQALLSQTPSTAQRLRQKLSDAKLLEENRNKQIEDVTKKVNEFKAGREQDYTDVSKFLDNRSKQYNTQIDELLGNVRNKAGSLAGQATKLFSVPELQKLGVLPNYTPGKEMFTSDFQSKLGQKGNYDVNNVWNKGVFQNTDISKVSPEAISQIGLAPDQYQRIVDVLNDLNYRNAQTATLQNAPKEWGITSQPYINAPVRRVATPEQLDFSRFFTAQTPEAQIQRENVIDPKMEAELRALSELGLEGQYEAPGLKQDRQIYNEQNIPDLVSEDYANMWPSVLNILNNLAEKDYGYVRPAGVR